MLKELIRPRELDWKLIAATAAILSIWLALVILAMTTHEFWRDEVRALSLARAAASPLDLYELVKYDGHPVLWFLILFVGKSVASTPLILPILSIAIAFAAVALLMFCSPLPYWIRCLFIFCAFPAYEYSVVARNYGISMLLLFVVAALYKHRSRFPLLLAFLLALLANTNVHSAVFVLAILGIWVWDLIGRNDEASDGLDRRHHQSIWLPATIVIGGLLLCAAFVMPRDNTILTSTVDSVDFRTLLGSAIDAAIRPDRTFALVVPSAFPSWVAAGVLYLAVIGLLGRRGLFCAAVASQVALGMMFRVVYPGEYRHQGLFLVFLMFLYWISLDSRSSNHLSAGANRLLLGLGVNVALALLIAGNVPEMVRSIRTDISSELTSSKALGEFLTSTEPYQGAIIVPEPDYLMESLPFYAPNEIYFPRERRFGTTVSWTTEADYRLTLGGLLSAARVTRARYGKPVMIVLGHYQIGRDEPQELRYSYNKVFSWNASEIEELYESTTLVRDFDSAAGDENYRVYLLR